MIGLQLAPVQFQPDLLIGKSYVDYSQPLFSRSSCGLRALVRQTDASGH